MVNESNKSVNIAFYIFCGIWLFIIIGACVMFGFLFWENYKVKLGNSFCELHYNKDNSIIYEEVWGEFSLVEEGYIRCCRYVLVNHELEKECEIVEYDNCRT